ncbi:MAG: toll/interleukin-1 receptor domain-containing protein [Steroidobacteraceae bacterium]
MADIFLSYNREDQATARRFADGFEREGFSVWWDATLRSGEAYDEVTEQALRDAKAVVVLWSKQSVISRWVRAEATLADRNKTLVPVMIEQCQRPIMFELTQTADLSAWSGDTSAGAWQAYVADVRRFVQKDSLGMGIAAESCSVRGPSPGRFERRGFGCRPPAFHRRAALRQFKRRQGAGVFQRWVG